MTFPICSEGTQLWSQRFEPDRPVYKTAVIRLARGCGLPFWLDIDCHHYVSSNPANLLLAAMWRYQHLLLRFDPVINAWIQSSCATPQQPANPVLNQSHKARSETPPPPPRRNTLSERRIRFCSSLPIPRRTSSPASCPKVSLIFLKLSRSNEISVIGSA